MTLPLKMLFGIIASQQGGGTPPAPPYHIRTLCYDGDGNANRRFDVPGVNLSASGSGMFMVRCLTDNGDTMAFLGQTEQEGYILSNNEQHEWCAPHRISEMGDGYLITGSEPSWYNAVGRTYSIIAIDGDFFDGGVHDGGLLHYPHSLGLIPYTLWISEDRNADVPAYSVRSTTEPEKRAMFLDTKAADFATTYWNEELPTSSVYSCTTEYSHAYFAFGDVAGRCATISYEGNGAPMTVSLGFKPKFAIIKEYFDEADWFWFSETMESCDRYHVGTFYPSAPDDLLDFVSDGIYVKDSKLIKPTWYNVLAIG